MLQLEQQVEKARMLSSRSLTTSSPEYQQERHTSSYIGDFNARVGSRESDDDEWSGVRGPHVFGSVNDTGKELLSFLSVH